MQLGILSLSQSLSFNLFLLFSVKLEVFFALINREACSGSGKYSNSFREYTAYVVQKVNKFESFINSAVIKTISFLSY